MCFGLCPDDADVSDADWGDADGNNADVDNGTDDDNDVDGDSSTDGGAAVAVAGGDGKDSGGGDVLMDSSQSNRQITELEEAWPTLTEAVSDMISAEPIKHWLGP